ncbi:OXR1 (YPL196W) [Zygosaccharomyces parabailii]|uniref:Oxidation resistance protein 1 n=1 Tax=Zygosaccharomyces bailii (strain CLIB 213 / ATCC 58445 / CBS 680 / BCRC 21525 / NBRC 1098 / NCYC 1416 / NRRL Y-2227) TaxID=1333698 RepID=A0A8J2T3Z8_ZYGB2|nr:OXR1 (YPL196W) [Zygosaccharomyces parabailii]CDF87887.1 BN860_16732g1_1 [Zygosaccharomyces bailii CLIB 213]CDH12138.1 probable Oxidation resistance protein 1 [Zygosaccharomyces bailii ISA1307]
MKGTFNRWKSSWSQGTSDTNGTSQGNYTDETEGNSTRNTVSSNYDDQSLPPVRLNGYLPSTKKRLLTPEMCDEIRTLMPTRIQLYTDWHLLYSLEQHGSSLQSLYHNVAPKNNSPLRVGYVLVIRDNKHGIFGAYCNEPFHPTSDRRYYGNGECFLWKMEKVPNVRIGNEKNHQDHMQGDDEKWQFRGYPYTGINEFAIYCQSNFLSMGAGDGHYGLWCDDNLLRGVSNPSLTYGNDVLSREGKKFHIVALEVWRVG